MYEGKGKKNKICNGKGEMKRKNTEERTDKNGKKERQNKGMKKANEKVKVEKR